jgi:tetratricopeptide (TPR) repeat protein
MKNLPTITHRIAYCYKELGDYTLALNYIDLSLKTDSANSDYIMEKADVLYELGRADEAISEMSKYISLDRTFFYGYYRRGFFKDNTADYNGAIEDYTIAIALEPTYAYAYLGRADMYKAKGEEELAYADYKKVLEIDTVPESGSCAQYAYLALGNKERAIEFMNGVIESDKNDAGNYYDAACLYARMGETKKSLNMLETALHKGYRRFEHMGKDDDLENIRSTNEYKKLIEKYKL